MRSRAAIGVIGCATPIGDARLGRVGRTARAAAGA